MLETTQEGHYHHLLLPPLLQEHHPEAYIMSTEKEVQNDIVMELKKSTKRKGEVALKVKMETKVEAQVDHHIYGATVMYRRVSP